MEKIDDPLTSCLLWLASAEGTKISYGSLVGGLPLVDGRLTPSIFARAAERVNINAQVVRQPLLRLNSLLLPCVVLLENNNACVLQLIDRENNFVQVIFPEFGVQPQQIDLDEF